MTDYMVYPMRLKHRARADAEQHTGWPAGTPRAEQANERQAREDFYSRVTSETNPARNVCPGRNTQTTRLVRVRKPVCEGIASGLLGVGMASESLALCTGSDTALLFLSLFL